ncbi:helix-turn-helix transcriptional regulator [Anaerovoracaceae bacterium 41-7]|jgi:predicted transcriptional regulator YheO|uniref:Transcriptional regulator n=1 Tax=Anaerotruncus colihominis TaxID=169435 RepID=A0A845QKZ4_9FIRM|nr:MULTISPECIES: helix-turn-helix transcriptional regulator [Clostridia]MCI9476214.1 transcriptional regulator [Emergencia sp.]MCI9641149.1 transcriptional regulator [Emergencia sp.]NBH61741.1 transcriptional regulator [Anaerotruncus colihominis]NCE98660.1 transcriptional regulator [Emergencia sp. 1XD21-10]NCF02396.1 transcriptional regulator [Anaerotruncus sp. 80]
MVNNFDQLKQIADLVAAQFGSAAEVVIHDFTGELDHTIVYIVNGHVTGRTIGDAPTQSFLKYMNVNHPRKSIEKVRHISHLPNGRIIRSSTANFFDEDGTLNSSLCINQDITDLVALENAVKGLSESGQFETSVLSTNGNEFDLQPSSIHGMMDNIITEALAFIGTPPDKMNKDAKIKLLQFLDERGVFMIQKSGQKVCELLGISKFTLYNYLEEARGKEK